ncbi:MAG TPA: GNAT family N-acetyltransferase [Gemmatimonadaceae bacterium]
MTVHEQFVDAALLERWRDWITPALARFGVTGFGADATGLSEQRLKALVTGDAILFTRAIECDGVPRGLVVVTLAAWESGVLRRPVAKLAWLGADDFETAKTLVTASLDVACERDVVLLSASPGNSPTFIHVALTEAGFHLGSQALTMRADLDLIAPELTRIPLRGSFREATPADTESVVELARHGFVDARFTGDPFFPAEWGQALFAEWARNLMRGAADSVIVAEVKGTVVGFVSMTLDARRRAEVPVLLAIDRRYNGWGIGAMLVRLMFEWYIARGLKVFSGGTEKSNTPINAVYTRLGATFSDANLVYHATPVRP